MKKIGFMCFLLLGILFASCSRMDTNINKDEKLFSETENSIIKKCYSKDSSSDLLVFLNNNPEESVSAHRSAFPSDNENKLTKEEMFAQVWESLTEEEKEQLLENQTEATMCFENSIGINKETEIGRAALEGDTSELDNAARYYGLICRLEDNFGDKYIPAKFAPEELGIPQNEKIPVVQTVEYCMQNDLWENIEIIFTELNSQIKVEDLKKEFDLMQSNEIYDNDRAALVVGYKENALIDDLGKQLPDGAVLLMCSKQKAFLIAGNWLHAGIFSKSRYDDKKGDASFCVFTAQPDEYQNFPENMKPDRPGYACMDTVFMYTRQKRVAAILPKDYSTNKAEYAVNSAKRIFYDTKPAYSLPKQEFVCLGNSSHDETNKNTYCSKVVYTGWKKAGVDLDANTFAGNLVSPDDIYDSIFDRYASFTISFLWWSKTWTWKTYSATSNLLLKREQ